MFIACDESGKSKSAYLVIGSIWVDESKIPTLEAEVSNWRISRNFWREIHWMNVNSNEHYEKLYIEFLEICLQILEPIFRVVVVEKSKVNLSVYHKGNESLMQNKFLRLLISCFAIGRGIKDELKIVFDSGTTNTPKDTRNIIDRDLPNKISCFCPCNSHISSVVQLADLLTSATCDKWNKKIRVKSAQDKLVALIETHFKGDLSVPCLPTNKSNLDVWYWNPRKAYRP